jgi:hypothetical protein
MRILVTHTPCNVYSSTVYSLFRDIPYYMEESLDSGPISCNVYDMLKRIIVTHTCIPCNAYAL